MTLCDSKEFFLHFYVCMWCDHMHMHGFARMGAHMCLYVYSECTRVCLWRPKVDKSSIILLRYSLTRVGLSVKFRIHPSIHMSVLWLPCLCRWMLGYRPTATPTGHLCGFLGIQCWSSHLCGRFSNHWVISTFCRRFLWSERYLEIQMMGQQGISSCCKSNAELTPAPQSMPTSTCESRL